MYPLRRCVCSIQHGKAKILIRVFRVVGLPYFDGAQMFSDIGRSYELCIACDKHRDIGAVALRS
jgi:hypothetical protein